MNRRNKLLEMAHIFHVDRIELDGYRSDDRPAAVQHFVLALHQNLVTRSTMLFLSSTVLDVDGLRPTSRVDRMVRLGRQFG